MLRIACASLLAASIAAGPVLAQPRGTAGATRANAPAPGAHAVNGNAITLNFKDADIDSVIGAFGHLLGKTFIIDPRVRGKITLETPRPVTREHAYELLQSTLRLQGFSVVETNGLARVVPEADAKLQSGPVTTGRNTGGDQIVTQIFRLQHESATNLVPILRPLISANNTVTAYPANNSLVITDYAANLQRIARIVQSLDQPGGGDVEVIPLKYAMATDIAVSVTRILDDSTRQVAGAQIDPGQRVSLLADPRLNAVMIRTQSPARLSLAKSLIARLDQPSAAPGNINVVYLRNAEAVRLAQVLRGVLAGDPSAAANAGLGTSATGFQQQPSGLTNLQNAPGTALGQQPNSAANTPLQGSTLGTQQNTFVAGGAVIAADPSTNSLIITAPEPLYRTLRSVIDRLDARRAQVFIESLIVEVSAERAAELGIQWQFLGGLDPSRTGTQAFGGTNLPSRGAGGNILDVAQNPAAVGQGLNIGVVRGSFQINGTTIYNLGLLARALETGANANILATPNLLTLDNEEARIIIGQNVPFVTGQFTTPVSGGGATLSPFQTIERKDVGTTLRVKPQVSESGTVRLQIFQEVSSVQSTSLASGIITNRRAIESNVLVDDGQIIVLGGLIEERVEGGEQKVPGLGDVPVVGQLFRYDNRRRVKTNLLVFLRPVVLRDANAAYNVTADRYDYIRQLQGDSRLPNRFGLPDVRPGELPPMTPPPAPASPTGGAADGGAATPAAAPSEARRPTAPLQGGSLSPDISASRREPAPIEQGYPTSVQTAPNEVVVPLDRMRGGAPSSPSASPPSGAPPGMRPGDVPNGG